MKNSDSYISVKDFLDLIKKDVSLKNKADSNLLNHKITSWKIKTFKDLKDIPTKGTVNVLTKSFIESVKKLDAEKQKKLANTFVDQETPCIVIEKREKLNLEFFESLTKHIPLIVSKVEIEKLILCMENLLRKELIPFSTLHGVLVDIHGVGVLITGKSGIGKSESALDLIVNRGAKLIADDLIEVRKIGTKLLGSGPENIRYLMEIRGVGIVNIKDLFGVSSVMDEREIEIMIELDPWDENKEYDRLGIDTRTKNIMEVNVPYILIPVSPGRNTATIIDVAVRNHLLKYNNSVDKNE